VLPEIPVWATMTQCLPMITLWPIWTWLSILVPSPTTVSPKRARSIVVEAPISTSSPMRTMPSCSILRWRPWSDSNPKPSAPTTTPGWRMTRFPTRQPWHKVTFGAITQSSPIETPSPT